MLFKKIKYEVSKGSETVHIEYQRNERQNDTKKTVFEAFDSPLQSFKDALQNLDKYVIKICQLSDDYLQGLTIRSVSFSYSGEDEILGATITALKELSISNAPLVINTPHLPSTAYSESSDPDKTLPWGCEMALRNLIHEAERYMDGDRVSSQTKLDLAQEEAA